MATLELAPFTRWLASGERGISSEAIVSHLTGQQVGRLWSGTTNYPHDPDDFRRCELLLQQVPLARMAFPTMAAVSPAWARLVDAWAEIHTMIESEAPGYLHKRQGSAPLAFRLMQRVIAGGAVCDSCDGSGRGDGCQKCKGTGKRSGGRCRAPHCYRGADSCATCRGRGYTVKAVA